MNKKAPLKNPVDLPAWGDDILNKLGALEDAWPELALLEGAPPWVEEIMIELAGMALPKAAIAARQGDGARALGAFMGHVERFAKGDDLLQLVTQKAKEIGELDTALKKFTKVLKVHAPEKHKQLKEHEKQLGQLFAELPRQVPRIKKVMTHADKQSRNGLSKDHSRYLKGYAEALDTSLLNPDASLAIGPNALIYWYMATNWRDVVKMDSVTALDKWLKQLLGPLHSGNTLDKMKKICRKHGIHFRKAGRPRKLGKLK